MMGAEDRDGLAGEYALGLLEGAAAREAESLMATDAGFQALVADWRRRFGPLDATARPEPATDALWARIAASSRQEPQAAPAVAPAQRTARLVVRDAKAARTERQPNALVRWWRDVGFWRPASLVFATAAIVLAVGLAGEVGRAPTVPSLVAVLETPEGRPAAVVNAYADGTVQLVPIETVPVPEGRILEVWTLQDRAQGPVSIGRIDRARTLRLDLKSLGKPSAGHLFELTFEPQGGSPTGKPTGPVVMKGLAAERV